MTRIPDRVKTRLEYLAHKAEANIQMLFGVGMMISCGLLAMVFIVIALTELQSAGRFMIFPLGGVVFFVFLAILGYGICKSADTKLSCIHYVPPVREQIEVLPPKEILLRGSQALPASPLELLRPAGSQDTPREELLRPTSESKTE